MKSCTASLIPILIFVLAACQPPEEPSQIVIYLVADGRVQTWSYSIPVTVDEFLREANVEIGELDRLNPERFTQISDGMQVTIVRVTEQSECEQAEIPYGRRTILNEGLQPEQELLGQAGQNGVEEVCYRVRLEDGSPSERVEVRRTTITEPQDEIIYVGPTGEIEPVAVTGSLAYISNFNVWIIRGSSTTKRPLTTTGDLDPRVFSLSPNGTQLLIARRAAADQPANLFNQLWLLPDTTRDVEPIALIPENVLYGEWIPSREDTISYSTAEARPGEAPGWRALNDLWTMRLDAETGEALDVEELIEVSSGGLYGWWGTNFQWSPDGQHLAWVRADSMGIVDLETGEFTPLLRYPVFRTGSDWSWRANISWSPDTQLLVTTIHGDPLGSEPPENSPVFNIAVTDVEGSFQADMVQSAGIWSTPAFSPMSAGTDRQFPSGYLAYLRARVPHDSVSGDYDLFVADRDGSNARRIFPQDGQPGLRAQELAWSPDGHHIAFIYQGNLWIVDAEAAVAHQLTLDGGASNPVWTR
jgi:dipeptidyl aminopeptidase/acylaminoacyl peptidase